LCVPRIMPSGLFHIKTYTSKNETHYALLVHHEIYIPRNQQRVSHNFWKSVPLSVGIFEFHTVADSFKIFLLFVPKKIYVWRMVLFWSRHLLKIKRFPAFIAPKCVSPYSKIPSMDTTQRESDKSSSHFHTSLLQDLYYFTKLYNTSSPKRFLGVKQ